MPPRVIPGLTLAYLIKQARKDQIDGAKTILRTEEFYQIDRYMEALKIIDVWLDNILASYYPSQLTVIGSHSDLPRPSEGFEFL